MYYSKELFVNEEIRANYVRLNKLQTVLLLSVVISIALAALAVIITLGVIFPDTFMIGYAMAIFGTVMFVTTFSIVFPFQKKLDFLRNKQTEELKGKPIYEKYAELLKLGRELNKKSNGFAIGTVTASIIVVWILAVIFPYEFNNAYVFFFTTLACSLTLIARTKKTEQIKNQEAEISRDLDTENGALCETDVPK